MKKYLATLITYFVFQTLCFAADIYVDRSAPAGGDGSSWAMAFQTIEDAVAVASANDTIFIAEGIYRPQSIIEITVPLQIRGGYPSGGGVQNIPVNTTQVQADFDPSNLLPLVFEIGTNANSSFEGILFFDALQTIRTDSDIIIDQVTFFGSSLSDVVIDGNITSCVITNSFFSDSSGTSISNTLNSSSVDTMTVSNTTFQNGTSRGMLIGNEVQNLIMTNVNVTGFNSSAYSFILNSPNASLNNFTAEGNILTSTMIFYNNNVGTLSIRNSNFLNNTGISGVMQMGGGSLVIDNSNYINNRDTGVFPYTILNSVQSNVTITNSKFIDNYGEGSNPKIFRISDSAIPITATFENCEFKNNETVGSSMAGELLDVFGDIALTIDNCIFDDNLARNRLQGTQSAIFTNNILKNYTITEPLFRLSGAETTDGTFENNRFFDNTSAEFTLFRFANLSSKNNSYIGDITLRIDRVANAELVNDYFRGNDSGNEFLILGETATALENVLMISEKSNGTHSLIESLDNVSLNIVNTTLSSSNIDDTNVTINLVNDLPSTIRNSVIWSGSNLATSALTGTTSNLQVRHSLIKGEDPAGAGNLDGTIIGNTPIFVDPSDFDFRMQDCSPTINEGRNSYASVPVDFNNNPRVFETTIDLGAYELQIPASSSCTAVERPLCTALTLPFDGEVGVNISTNLNWTPDPNAIGYILRVGTALGSFDLLNETLGPVSSYNLLDDLPEGSEIFVRIVPFNGVGNAIDCVSESFTTETITVRPICTSLTIPLNGSTNVSIATDLTWTTIANADGYFVTVGTNSGGTDILDSFDAGALTTLDLAANLPENTEIFVTVIPYNGAGSATACTEESFTTETLAAIPNCTSLTTPLNGSTNVSIATDLTWTTIANADGYFVTVGTNSGGTDILDSFDAGALTTLNLAANLPENTEIFVTIIPYNGVGNATGCTEESFTTGTLLSAPNCTTLINPSNNSTNVAVNLNEISWNTVANATGYRVTIDGSASNANDLTALVVNGTSHPFTNNFVNGETVTVTIVPFNTNGDATGCTSESFTIVDTLTPVCTNITAPINGATDVPINTDLTWNPVSGATSYRLDISVSDGLNNITQIVTSNSYAFPNDFVFGETVTVNIYPRIETTEPATACASESFTIVAATTTLPSCTTLFAPDDGDTDINADLSAISWIAVANATGYRVSVNGSASDANDVTNLVVNGNSHPFANNFENGETVTVTIVPFNTNGDAMGCSAESFSITGNAGNIPSSCADLINPLANAIDVAVDLNEISWNAVANTDGYRITINGSTSNANDVTNLVVNGTSHPFTNEFDNGETVSITIIPFNTFGNAESCTIQSFTTVTIIAIPDCTRLITPTNEATDVLIDTDISWEEIPNADGYRLTMGTSSGASDILNNEDLGLLTSYTLINNLPFGTTIYISITPYNSEGDAIGCWEQSFSTADEELIESEYGFSPNGDGINDFWEIKGIESSPQNIVNIYNRWGDVVFTISNYDNQSNVFRGEANQLTNLGASSLPSGTYFFDIQINGTHNLKKLKGFVVLKR